MLYCKYFIHSIFLLECWSACNGKVAKYELTFYTPNIHRAGTDAQVDIYINWPKQSMSQSRSVHIGAGRSDDDHYLERGTVSTKRANLNVLGNISTVGVSRGSQGEKDDWLLEKVEMRQLNDLAKTKLLFLCNTSKSDGWIPHGAKTECNRVIGVNYSVRIWNHERTRIRANTIYIQIVGVNKTTPRHYDYGYPPQKTGHVLELSTHSFSVFAENIGPVIGVIIGIGSDEPSKWRLGEMLVSVGGKHYWFTSKDIKTTSIEHDKHNCSAWIVTDITEHTDWGKWSACNATCEVVQGTRIARRQCRMVGGGMSETAVLRERTCENTSSLIKTESCFKDNCPASIGKDDDDEDEFALLFRILFGLFVCLLVCGSFLTLWGLTCTVFIVVRAIQFCYHLARNDDSGSRQSSTGHDAQPVRLPATRAQGAAAAAAPRHESQTRQVTELSTEMNQIDAENVDNFMLQPYTVLPGKPTSSSSGRGRRSWFGRGIRQYR